jgi:hypothetical protein
VAEVLTAATVLFDKTVVGVQMRTKSVMKMKMDLEQLVCIGTC